MTAAGRGPLRVGVVGAGIGGLCTAVGLQRAGAVVTVLERTDGPTASGSGLSVFGNGWTALERLGVDVAALSAGAPPPRRSGQRRPDGRWLATTSASAVSRLRVVHRADLREALLACLEPGTVRWGTPAWTGAAHEGRLVLDDGAEVLVDVVVAADGLRSRTRASWPDDPGVRYAGYAAWRGVTRHPVDLHGAAGETWGRGRRFGYAPLPDGRVYWFAVAAMDEDAPDGGAGAEHAAVARMVARWHAPVADLVAATAPEEVHRLAVHDLATGLPRFVRGRCVLLGDAAHAMTPDLGQGGNQAMEDAATLTALLAPRAADPAEAAILHALAEYDRLRRPRTQAIAARARRVGQVAQAGGRWSSALRDVVLRMVPPGVLDRELVRIQAWRPPA